jgi:pSer/pThr/pTyr-binding forkhead associated (FHA) protein
MTSRPPRLGTLGMEGGGSRPPVGSQPVLVVEPGTPHEQRVAIEDRPIRIGSDADADLRIDDPHVSRRHAEVRRTSEGIMLRDLGSRNGTLVENLLVKEALLRDGTTILLGRTRIRYFAPTADAPPRGNTPPPSVVARFGGAIGESPAIRQTFTLLARVAPTGLAVTIAGEPGTGKKTLAS